MANETKPLPAPLPGTSAYEVTRGEDTRQIQAANKREAVRRFDNDDKRVEATLVKGDEKIPGLLPTGGATSPPKRRYKVTWGETEREVTAIHKDDAWSQFVGNKTDTDEWRNPNLYERIIEDLGPVEDEAKPKGKAKDTDESEGDVSPVADYPADEAKDQISRMHSREKLQQIIAADHRVSVQHAAQKRLEEIGG